MVNVPYYMSNDVIQRDVSLAPVKEVIKQFSSTYDERLANHPNILVNQLNISSAGEVRRLKRLRPGDLVNTDR